jgi:hypothetical protein
MYQKILFIIIFLSLFLFIIGCEGYFGTSSNILKNNLGIQVYNIVQEQCACDTNTCSCVDPYAKNNVVYLDCRNVTVSSVGDILKRCSYWSEVDGWHFSSKERNLNG